MSLPELASIDRALPSPSCALQLVLAETTHSA